jgi:hypothetical protein
MATGETYTGSLAAAEPLVISSARRTREYKGVMSQLCDKRTLGRNMGRTWYEYTMDQLTSQSVTETTVLDNPQELTGSRIGLTPEVVGIETIVTDRAKDRLSRNVVTQFGQLGQESNLRKRDQDGLAIADSATTTLAGAGTTLTYGHLAAGSSRITSNTTEPGQLPIRIVLHGFQIKDVQDQVVSGVGTYPIGSGMTADVFKNNLRGMVAGGQLYEDGNISIDSNTDAHGLMFAQRGVIMVQGRSPWMKTKDLPDTGGGATAMYLYDEYVFGERSAGNWLVRILSDATAPTS